MTPEQETQALADLTAITKRYERTEAAHREVRGHAVEAVLALLRSGVAPAKVERASPFTGSYIRRLARDAGIPGDSRYDRTRD